MLLLLVILICLLTYKLFSNWIWWLLPIAVIFDLGLWILHHPILTGLIVAICFALYDKFIYQAKHGHSMFYDDSKDGKPFHTKS